MAISFLRFRARGQLKGVQPSHSIRDYQKLVRRKLRQAPSDRALALAQAIGAETMDSFVSQGDGHVAVLRHHGLVDGMKIYDLGCGCGRTAQALQRQGWRGSYIGTDVVPELLEELAFRCPGYETRINMAPTILVPDGSLDMLFHWSVFTHLYPAESYLYTVDAFRALKPGGKMIFSFLELEETAHDRVWQVLLDQTRAGRAPEPHDAFLHRDWIRRFARDAGFVEPQFTDGTDETHHPAFWQALAILERPA